MFESSLVESSGALRSKSSRYVWATGAFNAAVVAVMILLPLLYPEALPKAAVTAMLSAPPPPPPSPPPTPPKVATEITRPAARLDAYTAPSRIPTAIDRTREDPPPSFSAAGASSMTMSAPGGGGVMAAMGGGADAPMVKVATPRPATAARVSGGVVAGNKLSGASPVYPAIAKAAHVSGAVVLHAIISRTGSIERLEVISGPEMLRASAVQAVQEWRYRPYLLNGEATDVDTTITVNFSFGG